jgi:hypothetical protein
MVSSRWSTVHSPWLVVDGTRPFILFPAGAVRHPTLLAFALRNRTRADRYAILVTRAVRYATNRPHKAPHQQCRIEASSGLWTIDHGLSTMDHRL